VQRRCGTRGPYQGVTLPPLSHIVGAIKQAWSITRAAFPRPASRRRPADAFSAHFGELDWAPIMRLARQNRGEDAMSTRRREAQYISVISMSSVRKAIGGAVLTRRSGTRHVVQSGTACASALYALKCASGGTPVLPYVPGLRELAPRSCGAASKGRLCRHDASRNRLGAAARVRRGERSRQAPASTTRSSALSGHGRKTIYLGRRRNAISRVSISKRASAVDALWAHATVRADLVPAMAGRRPVLWGQPLRHARRDELIRTAGA